MFLRMIVLVAVVVLIVILLAPSTSAFGQWIATVFERAKKPLRGYQPDDSDPPPTKRSRR